VEIAVVRECTAPADRFPIRCGREGTGRSKTDAVGDELLLARATAIACVSGIERGCPICAFIDRNVGKRLTLKALPNVFVEILESDELTAQPLRFVVQGEVRQHRTTFRWQSDRFAALDCSLRRD
jgi:hypothetical protein